MEEWYWKGGGFARTSGMFGALLDKTYVCSSAAHKVLTSVFKREAGSVAVMHIGVDENKFDAHRVKKGCLYEKLNISKDRPIVLFPCRIDAQKRPFLMLYIAQNTSRKIPNILFAVVGDGPQRRTLERTIAKSGLSRNVICIGPSDHMEQCYKDAKITLICSIKEGLSLTAYESCAMGTPISSSMTEMYTNMRYLQYDTLQRLGFGRFDAWASTFGEIVTAVDGTLKNE